MFNKLKILGVASVLALSAGMASAATITFTGGTGGNAGTIITGNGLVGQNNFATGGANVNFTWADTTPGYLAYAEFTVVGSWELVFNDYSPEQDLAGGVDARSGFQLYSGSFGSTAAMLTDTSGGAPCGSDVLASFGSTSCILVTGADNDPAIATTPPSTYGVYESGTYVLMFSEGNNPTNGHGEFLISSVPIPAAGFLLLGALGGLGFAGRRRRKAA